MTQQNPLAAADSTKATILLVDDEQSVRSIVLKILRRASYNVIEAENGEAALKLAESHPGTIDLVITDMYMPGLRGPEVAARLALTRPGLRVLFMSGYSEEAVYRHEILEAVKDKNRAAAEAGELPPPSPSS